MTTIVQDGHPALRTPASPVSLADIGTEKLNEILVRMKEALWSQSDGVAIAAPQIAVPLRIFIVAGFIFKKKKDIETPPDKVFINPEILSLSKEKEWLEEGCLSVRYLYGEVSRSKKAKVRAYDEHGKRFTIGASGLLAQIFQHETDHLNATLFIDTARNVREMTPEEMAALAEGAAIARTNDHAWSSIRFFRYSGYHSYLARSTQCSRAYSFAYRHCARQAARTRFASDTFAGSYVGGGACYSCCNTDQAF
jgi:peptide deformylase